MALKLIEGFDMFTDDNQIGTGRKFRFADTNINTNARPSIVGGRLGGAALQQPGAAFFANATVLTFAPVSQLGGDTISYGMAVNLSQLGRTICGLASSGTPQFLIGCTASGYLNLHAPETSGNSTWEIKQTSSNIFMDESIWYYLEVKVSTVGGNTIQVWVNGELALTGNNVPFTNTADFNELLCGSVVDGGQVNGICSYDDIYLLDSTTSINNDRLGDVRVELFRPSSDTTLTMTPNGETTAFEALNDIGPDGDSTTVSSATAGDRALMASTDSLASAPESIFGVAVNVVAKKSGADSAALDFLISSNSVEDTVTGRPLLDTYSVDEALFENNPDGDVPWTRSAVESLQFGVEVSS